MPTIELILYQNLFLGISRYVVTNVKHMIGKKEMKQYEILNHHSSVVWGTIKLNGI